jgi:superfamily II DNA or RNA helicase
VLGQVDVRSVSAVVGARSFARGWQYAEDGHVLDVDWDEDDEVLAGRVRGNGAVYETEADLERRPGRGYVLVEGTCTCPVEVDCKHVAAVALVAGGLAGRAPAEADAGASGDPAAGPAPRLEVVTTEDRGWRAALAPLVDTAADTPTGTPLALELRLDQTGAGGAGARTGGAGGAGGQARLAARIMQRGRRRWVYGGLSWGQLHTRQVRQADYRADHLDLVRQLHALHRARPDGGPTPGYALRPDTDKMIDLAGVGRALWPLLEEAERLGLPLLHADSRLGPVDLGRTAQLHLDATLDSDGSMVLRPGLRVDGLDDEVVVLGFLGADGHGVVWSPRSRVAASSDPRAWPLGLAPLATPAPAALRRLTRSGRTVDVPADDVAAFRLEVWPQLRHAVSVTSSDGSFTPPDISGPRLVLAARYGPDHVLDVTPAWGYAVGDAERRFPPDGLGDSGDPGPDSAGLGGSGGGTGIRDLQAEDELGRSLAADTGLDRVGLITSRGLGQPLRLRGLDTMRFTTEVLPLLDDRDDIVVEVAGDPAEFRDVGDSLTVGLSTDAVAGETDWFDLGVTVTVDGHELPFTTVFGALAGDQPHLLLPDGAWFSLEKPELQSLRQLIAEARTLHDQPLDGLRINRYQVDLWDELCQLGVVTRQADTWARQVDTLRDLAELEDVDLPADLTAELRPYQRDGFRWLAFLWQHGMGGVLADDMGLGKTLQTLALICHARAHAPTRRPFLVVAPTSVVPNWVEEAARFAPGLSVAAVRRTGATSGRTVDELAEGADVVVTSYTLLRLDAAAYRSVDWAGMVLDEAQHAKNHRSKVYGCIRRLPAPFKLVITGTPMENNLMELWSLLSIAAPGLFPDPVRFAQHYAQPIERQGDGEVLDRLRRRIRPLMKRRTKELVAADLPPKQEQVVTVDLHPRHRKAYDTHLQRERQKILGLIDDFDRNRFTILRSITLLRQLSLHPALVGDDEDDDAAGVPCAKLDSLVEAMQEVVAGGHRALVFSQFTGFLDLVGQRLDAEGIEHCRLDGRTRRRDEVLRRFKDGTAPAFLISLKAGGFGLNLTEADYCFLLDPWWNPATEAQAIDRTHRIGQTRHVFVYRLVSRGTIEEKVMALARRKAALFTGVLDDGDLFSGALDVDDVRSLFA